MTNFQGTNSVQILQAPTTHWKDMTEFNVMLKKFSLNLTDHKVYIIPHKAMIIANLVDIFCTNEYTH